MKCKYCQGDVPDAAQKCRHCGSRIKPVAFAGAPVWIWVIVFIVIFLYNLINADPVGMARFIPS